MNLRVFDDGDPCGDGSGLRYTIIDAEKPTDHTTSCGRKIYLGLTLSNNPDSPQGKSVFGKCVVGTHLGDEIKTNKIPSVVLKHAKRRLDTKH